jgi:hypothetical protein
MNDIRERFEMKCNTRANCKYSKDYLRVLHVCCNEEFDLPNCSYLIWHVKKKTWWCSYTNKSMKEIGLCPEEQDWYRARRS